MKPRNVVGAAACEQENSPSLILKEYKGRLEKGSDELPPHWPTDCSIEILPEAKLPKPKLYSMTPKELEKLCSFIDENLEWGFIQLE